MILNVERIAMHNTNKAHDNEVQETQPVESAANLHTKSISKRVIVAAVAGLASIALITTAALLWRTKTTNTAHSAQTNASKTVDDICDTTTTLVASVNQWGSLATQIGGSCVQVTSLINSTSADPHDYEPTTSDIAALQKADIVLINGAGYDQWASNAVHKNQKVINVASLMGIESENTSETESEGGSKASSGNNEENTNENSGEKSSGHNHEHNHSHSHGDHNGHHHHGTTNPHLWFSPEAILKTEQTIATTLQEKLGTNSQSAATVQKLANQWHTEYSTFINLANSAKADKIQRTYVSAEPVANYLLEFLGAQDLTPSSFTNAMNSEAEPSPADINNTLKATTTADIVIINPQELSGYAKQIQNAAKQANRTIVSVSEQLPEQQSSLLSWVSSITKQVLANDTSHGYFLTQNVTDRTMGDYEGHWQSIYPYLENGTLDPVMKAKAANSGQSVDEIKSYYETGYATDVTAITISGNTMSFTTAKSSSSEKSNSNGDSDEDSNKNSSKTSSGKENTVTATYRYDGYRILDYKKGNRGVRYLFTATGDVPQGAPTYVQFSDHGITSGHAEHFHIFMGDAKTNHDELLKEMDHWPTYYPAELDGPAIVKEMLAHN